MCCIPSSGWSSNEVQIIVSLFLDDFATSLILGVLPLSFLKCFQTALLLASWYPECYCSLSETVSDSCLSNSPSYSNFSSLTHQIEIHTFNNLWGILFFLVIFFFLAPVIYTVFSLWISLKVRAIVGEVGVVVVILVVFLVARASTKGIQDFSFCSIPCGRSDVPRKFWNKWINYKEVDLFHVKNFSPTIGHKVCSFAWANFQQLLPNNQTYADKTEFNCKIKKSICVKYKNCTCWVKVIIRTTCAKKKQWHAYKVSHWL